MPSSLASSVSVRRSPIFRPSAPVVALATILFLGTGCSYVSGGVVAEALFQVSTVQPALLDQDLPQFDVYEYDILRRTQIGLLKSYFVLTAAIRDPSIASMPMLSSRTDPVTWLQENLEVEFLDGSEILSIRLRGTKSEADDLRDLVNSVAAAYEKEVVYNERQRRLLKRNAKAKTGAKLAKDLTEKMAEVAALRKELKDEAPDSSELQFMQLEVEILTDVYRQLRRSLEIDDVEYNAPPWIRQIQQAVVSPD